MVFEHRLLIEELSCLASWGFCESSNLSVQGQSGMVDRELRLRIIDQHSNENLIADHNAIALHHHSVLASAVVANHPLELSFCRLANVELGDLVDSADSHEQALLLNQLRLLDDTVSVRFQAQELVPDEVFDFHK